MAHVDPEQSSHAGGCASLLATKHAKPTQVNIEQRCGAAARLPQITQAAHGEPCAVDSRTLGLGFLLQYPTCRWRRPALLPRRALTLGLTCVDSARPRRLASRGRRKGGLHHKGRRSGAGGAAGRTARHQQNEALRGRTYQGPRRAGPYARGRAPEAWPGSTRRRCTAAARRRSCCRVSV